MSQPGHALRLPVFNVDVDFAHFVFASAMKMLLGAEFPISVGPFGDYSINRAARFREDAGSILPRRAWRCGRKSVQ